MDILIDLDDVVLDTTGAILCMHNLKFPRNVLTREDLSKQESGRYMQTVGAFYDDESRYEKSVRPMPGASRGLDLIAQKHRVTLLSAYSNKDTTARKRRCLEKYMPQHSSKLVGCVKGSKAKYPADMIIDDQILNLCAYRLVRRKACVVVVDQPWNRNLGSEVASIRWPGVVEGEPGWPALARWLIDPDTCHCGQATGSHGPWEGHSPVPMGCGCHEEPDWNKIATTCKILLFQAKHELQTMKTRDQRMGELDNCGFCLGAKGNVRGNENVYAGILVCDDCSVLVSRILAKRNINEKCTVCGVSSGELCVGPVECNRTNA